MARTYSDPSYGSKKTLELQETGALNASESGATTVGRHTFMQPVTITDANLFYEAGGSTDCASIIFGKSAAGTGSVTAFGTQALGDNADNTVTDASVSSTNFDTGDDLVIQRALGTTTSVENVVPSIQYVERFVESDS